ncbi:nucleotidyltransferase family protein [Natrialba sp. PRR66]|uniref:nucleotidyltransferase family protein n=1 Tax=Natrialba sp. PRR66 TaxID=3098146 RepID=UPI002B1DD39C|nr:nucleotidyltransferase family protein [Natrialba sp. PRR66]
MGNDGIPIITPSSSSQPTTNHRENQTGDQNQIDGSDEIAGVVLAAGTSSRFGAANKLLVDLKGRPIVAHAVETMVASEVDPVIVVIGHEADRVADALADQPVTLVRNDEYARGQAASIGVGIDALETSDVAAAVFALGDMPFVSPETVDTLVTTYRTRPETALAAAYDSSRGNPVLFDRSHFERLADVSGDTGGRAVLLKGDRSALVATDDPGVVRDIDTPADLP